MSDPDGVRDRADGGGVTVVGTGRVAVRPDLLVARLAAEVTAGSVDQALESCSVAAQRLADALRSGGVTDTDLSTSGATVTQAYDENGQPRGWAAAQRLTARIRRISGAGDLIGAAIGAAGDAGRLHEVAFAVADDAVPAADARERAFADAAAKAAQYARLAGRGLGKVGWVREAGVGAPYRGAETLALRASAMPIETGELEVTATVEIHWSFAASGDGAGQVRGGEATS